MNLIVQLTQFTVSFETSLSPVDIDFVLGFGGSKNVVLFQETMSFFGLIGLSETEEGKRLLDLWVFLDKDTGDLSKLTAFVFDGLTECVFRKIREIFEINIGFGLISIVSFFKSHAFNYFAA